MRSRNITKTFKYDPKCVKIYSRQEICSLISCLLRRFRLTVQHIDEVLTPAPLIEKDTENHAIFKVPIIVIPGEHVYSKYAGVVVSVCKRFEFVITSMNKPKMTSTKIVG